MNQVRDFDYTLRASGRTVGTTKLASAEETVEMTLADGTFVQVRQTLEITVIQPTS